MFTVYLLVYECSEIVNFFIDKKLLKIAEFLTFLANNFG